jgi:hypothetical protein
MPAKRAKLQVKQSKLKRVVRVSRPARKTSVLVVAPAARSRVTTTKQARVRSTLNHINIIHRELIALLDASTTEFPLNSYPINPANSIMFPWLSQMTGQWETYKFRKLVFTYVSQSSTASDGSITISVDFDPLDAPPTDIQSMMSMVNTVSGPLWAGQDGSLSQRASTQNLSKQKSYYLAEQNPPGSDLKTYNIGNLFVSVSSGTGAVIPKVGQLWVDYDVDFFTPQQGVSAQAITDTLLDTANIIQSTLFPDATPLFGQTPVNITNKSDFAKDLNIQSYTTILLSTGATAAMNWAKPVIASALTGLFMKVYLWLSGNSYEVTLNAKAILMQLGVFNAGISYNRMSTNLDFTIEPNVGTFYNNGGYYEAEFYIGQNDLDAIVGFPPGTKLRDVYFAPIFAQSSPSDVIQHVQIDTYNVPAPLLSSRKQLSMARYQNQITVGTANVSNQFVVTVASGTAADFFASASYAGAGIEVVSAASSILSLRNFIPGYYYAYWFLSHSAAITTPELIFNDAGGPGVPIVTSGLGEVIASDAYANWTSLLVAPDSNGIDIELGSTTFATTGSGTLVLVPLLA